MICRSTGIIRGWSDAQHRFQLVLKQCCKTSGRFFCPFPFNITRSKNMLEMEIKSNIVCSRESALAIVVNTFNVNRNTTALEIVRGESEA